LRHAPYGTIQMLQRINNDFREQQVPAKEREDSEMEKHITQNTYMLWTLLRMVQGVFYEMLIYGMRCIVLIIAAGMLAAVNNIWPILRWPYLIHQFGTVARNAAFPLLVIFILLAHRKAHPTSPLARKPIREQPLPLLRG